MLLLSFRLVISYLCADERFGFTVLMIHTIVSYILPFMVLLVIIMLSFAVIFFSFTHTVEVAPVEEEGGQNIEILEQIWSIYKLAIMGDFGDEIEVSLMMKFAFI